MHAVTLESVQLLMEQLPDCPFFVKDGALRYVVANTAMARLCGARSASALVGRRAADFFPAPLARHYEALDRRVLASGRPVTHQLERVRSGRGEPTWLMYARTPIAERGETVGVAAVSREIRPPDRLRGTYERVERAIRIVRAGYDRPLGLAAIARECGVSASQLERDFTRVLELTPRDVHTMARIDRALELLSTGTPVSRVAQECGFTDHSAFTRRFRGVVGRTPLEYARASAGVARVESRKS